VHAAGADVLPRHPLLVHLAEGERLLRLLPVEDEAVLQKGDVRGQGAVAHADLGGERWKVGVRVVREVGFARWGISGMYIYTCKDKP